MKWFLFIMLSNPLILYDTQLPQGLTDARTFQMAYGLPHNVVGCNFGSRPYNSTQAQFGSTYKIAANTLVFHGTTFTAFDGQSLFSTFPQLIPNFGFDGFFCSTHTPLIITSTPSGFNTTVPGRLALQMKPEGTFLPNGRLGATANTTNYDHSNELLTRSGQRAFDVALAGDLAARTTFNFSKPVLSSNAASGVLPIDNTLGFTLAYWQTLLATLRNKPCNWSVNLGSDYPYGTGAGNDFRNGSLGFRAPVFGFVGPFQLQSDTNAPGAHVYSNNYAPLPGAWSVHWYSFLQYWAWDFLWNEGAAAMTTLAEPLSNGVRDPASVLAQLFTGKSMCEAIAAITQSCPTQAVDDPSRVTVIGNPLATPYAVSIANPPPAGADVGI